MDSSLYNIKTMQDVLDCVTKDNIDNFMVDFRNYVECALSMKTILLSLCDAEGVDKDAAYIKTDGFIWVDDGKHDISVKLKQDTNEG